MNSITIITIVVVALLTILIFGLTWFSYSSCLKSYKLEVSSGYHDKQIKKEYKDKKKCKGGLLGLVGSWVILPLLLSIFACGIIYRTSGNNFILNNQTALVIKSNSMSDFYNEEIAQELNNDRSLQFDVGDICIFEKVSNDDSLVPGEVYGYKYKNIIITHRLVSIDANNYRFRGDNNRAFDGNVYREDILFHYVGKKVPTIGVFVLYAQSYFGIWSLVSIIGIMIFSELIYHKIDKINENRLKFMPRTIFTPREYVIELNAYEKAIRMRWPQLGGKKDEK